MVLWGQWIWKISRQSSSCSVQHFLLTSYRLALRCKLFRRNLQIHCTRHSRTSISRTRLILGFIGVAISCHSHHLSISWATTTNFLPVTPNTIFIFRTRANKQLHWKPFCWNNHTCTWTLHRHGGGHTELKGRHFAIGERGRSLEAGAILAARRVDPLGHCYGRGRHDSIGDHCIGVASKWEGWFFNNALFRVNFADPFSPFLFSERRWVGAEKDFPSY